MDYIVIGWEGVDWTHMAQDKTQRWAICNRVMNFLSVELVLSHIEKKKLVSWPNIS